jgi:predicted MarR family transcription regulator
MTKPGNSCMRRHDSANEVPELSSEIGRDEPEANESADGTRPGLRHVEFDMIGATHAYQRWIVRSMTATRLKDL